MAKRPSFQFYPGDWQSNHHLKRCDFHLKGVWVEIICLFHDSDEYGILRWTLDEISNAVGCTIDDLNKLVRFGILKGTDKDADKVSFSPSLSKKNDHPYTITLIDSIGPLWFSSRMVRDEYVRQKRAAGGAKSLDNPNVPQKKDSEIIIDKDTLKDIDKDTLSPSPSSSSSSSSSLNTIKRERGKKLSDKFDLNFEEWQEYVKESKEKMLSDSEYIKQMESDYPNLNVRRTIEKSFEDFFMARDGWKLRKGSSDCNWISAMNYQCGPSGKNRVFKQQKNKNAHYLTEEEFCNVDDID